MINYEKIKLMFENIKSIGLKNFSELSLTKLLENLNPKELDEFFLQVPNNFENNSIDAVRLINMQDIVLEQIEIDYLKISKSDYYAKFCEDIQNINDAGRIDIDLTKYKKLELGNLQFAINHSIDFEDEENIKASSKLISLIKNEIKEREKKTKPTFENAEL